MRKLVLGVLCAAIALSGCSREQGDWEKARAANNTDSYELFIKKYPNGEFTSQAQARVKELYEERDWQKARDTDTLEAYQNFMKQHPEGKWTEEARIRVENFSLAQTPAGASPAAGAQAGAGAGSEKTGSVAGASTAEAQPPPAPAAPIAKPPTVKGPPSASGSLAPSAVASAAAAPAAATGKTHAAGSYGVQLGAFKSGRAAANRRWSALEKQYPTLLAGLKHRVTAGSEKSGTLYRLQVRGLSETKARSLCQALKAKSEPCLLVLPHH
jgi:cell division protein FtsN